MVQIGDRVQCPECHKIAQVVWLSQDEKLAGIRCPRRHSQIIRGNSKFGSYARPQAKLKKNMVFLMDIQSLSPASAKR